MPETCTRNNFYWSPLYNCFEVNTRTKEIVEALKSFPSFHAAVAMYRSVIFVLYYEYMLCIL